MATEQKEPSGQPNPEDVPQLSDYEEEPDQPDVINVDRLVSHWEDEARDLAGDPVITFTEQITSMYKHEIQFMYDHWDEQIGGSNFFSSANQMYKKFEELELEELRYNYASQKQQIFKGMRGSDRHWISGSKEEVANAMQDSKARLVKLLGDHSEKIRLIKLFESVKAELPGIGFEQRESPKKQKAKKTSVVKNQAYFESIDVSLRTKEVVADWRSIWKSELGGIMATFTSEMREVQMAEILETKLFPKWLERYGKADIVPSDLLKDGKGNPYDSDKKAIRSKFKASKMKLPAFMVGGPTSPAQAIKIEFVKALRNSDASYQKHRREYHDESRSPDQDEEKSPTVVTEGELKTQVAMLKKEYSRLATLVGTLPDDKKQLAREASTRARQAWSASKKKLREFSTSKRKEPKTDPKIDPKIAEYQDLTTQARKYELEMTKFTANLAAAKAVKQNVFNKGQMSARLQKINQAHELIATVNAKYNPEFVRGYKAKLSELESSLKFSMDAPAFAKLISVPEKPKHQKNYVKLLKKFKKDAHQSFGKLGANIIHYFDEFIKDVEQMTDPGPGQKVYKKHALVYEFFMKLNNAVIEWETSHNEDELKQILGSEVTQLKRIEDLDDFRNAWNASKGTSERFVGSIEALSKHIQNLKGHIDKVTHKRIDRRGDVGKQQAEKSQKIAQLHRERKDLEAQHASMMREQSSKQKTEKQKNIEGARNFAISQETLGKIHKEKDKIIQFVKENQLKSESSLVPAEQAHLKKTHEQLTQTFEELRSAEKKWSDYANVINAGKTEQQPQIRIPVAKQFPPYFAPDSPKSPRIPIISARRRPPPPPPGSPVRPGRQQRAPPRLRRGIARPHVRAPRVPRAIQRRAYGEPSDVEIAEERAATFELAKTMHPRDMARMKWNRQIRQWSVKDEPQARVYSQRENILHGAHVINSTSHDEIVYLQPPPESAYDNRFININPRTEFRRRVLRTDPISGTNSSFWGQIGNYIHISAKPRAIHITFLNKTIPDRALNILISRIIEHTRSNDIINPRLLYTYKLKGKKILSMIFNAQQLRTSSTENLKRVIQKALRRSRHFLLKQDNPGGVFHKVLQEDNVLI